MTWRLSSKPYVTSHGLSRFVIHSCACLYEFIMNKIDRKKSLNSSGRKTIEIGRRLKIDVTRYRGETWFHFYHSENRQKRISIQHSEIEEIIAKLPDLRRASFLLYNAEKAGETKQSPSFNKNDDIDTKSYKRPGKRFRGGEDQFFMRGTDSKKLPKQEIYEDEYEDEDEFSESDSHWY